MAFNPQISTAGLIPLQIESNGNLITTQVNKINFVGAVTGSIGRFNNITIQIGIIPTASFAISSSYALVATTASYALTSTSASYASASTSASYAATASFVAGGASGFPYTGSAQITGSLGITGSFSQSGSTNIFLQGLINQTTATTHVVTFNNATGQLFITASSAFGGGGGGGTPGGATNTIQFNNAGTFSGSNNFTLVGGNFVYLTGSLLVTGSSQFLGPVTGSSFTGSFTGSLFGTSSWAVSASQAISSSIAISSSFALTASLAPLYVLTSATSSMLVPYVLNSQTSSFVTNTQTSSFVQNSQTSSFTTTSSFNAFTSSINAFTSSINTATSSFITNSQTSSFVQNSQTSSFVINSQTSSFVQNSQTSSMLAPYLLTSRTSSFATTGSNTFKDNQIVTGSITSTSEIIAAGNVTAQINLKSMFQAGDEGGEIFLNVPATNTTLATGVTIDINQNKLRFFEQGGGNRGYYLDISSGSASVGTNLKPAGFTGTVTILGNPPPNNLNFTNGILISVT